jgi:rhodanese-related sulfurtransferase
MPIEQLTPPQAAEALKSDPDAIFVDVRTEGEFAAGHPEGALNIPVLISGPGGMQPNPDFLKVAAQVLPRGRKIVCSCQVGRRSQMAAQMLEQSGYASLVNVRGGFGGEMNPATGQVVVQGWKAAGLPVSSSVNEANSYAGLREKAGL